MVCGAAGGSTAESSQTDSDDVSPAARRRAALRPLHAHPLHASHVLVARIPDLPKKEDKGIDKPDKPEKSKPIALATKSMRRSASTSGLSLVIHPAEDTLAVLAGGAGSPCAGNTSSTNSSRDSSPCRDPPSPFALANHSLIQSSKPPIVVRRGPRGFGFTIHTVRVYYGDTDYYTMHHLVSAVSEQGAAWAAGLRAGDLITQLNGESVQGLLHTQVLRLLLAAPHATLRATPLEQTTIQAGGRKRAGGRRASAPPRPRPRRRCSLFRRISTKRASQEMHQMVSGASSELPSPAASPAADSPLHTTHPTTHYQRPSSLHGLKHKLSGGEVRRASLQHMPLSPLARTPSPSPQPAPASPTSRGCEARSPSPLAARECRRAWPRRDPASPLLRRALSPDRLHPRSAESKCSISPLCCGGVGGAGGAVSSRRAGSWRPPAPAPPTPPPPDKPDEPSLPRIAEEKDSPTHHAARLPARTPVKQGTPSIFTSSPKASVARDASASFASLSLSDESYVDLDVSNIDTSNARTDDSHSSTESTPPLETTKKIVPLIESTPAVSEMQTKTRKKSDSSLKEEDLKIKDKSKSRQEKQERELKKQDSMKKIEKIEVKEEKRQDPKEEKTKEKTMERSGSVRKQEKQETKEAKKQEKQERAEKKQEKMEAKRSESMKKIELKKQESFEVKSPEAESEGRKSMVSKLLGVMGRKRDDEPTRKDKRDKKKNTPNPPQQQVQKNEQDRNTDKDEEKKPKKGRGRASSSSSGEK